MLLVVVAVVVAVIIKTLFLQAFYIPSPSMEPGLVKNDRILVEKPSYWFGTPQRGDVVVFADPDHWLDAEEAAGPTNPVATALSKIGLYPTGGHLVKRVIGVAGDTISCCDAQGRLEVNGQPLQESSYAREGTEDCYGPMPKGRAYCHWRVGPVPAGKLFVMGDNRGDSADSSYHAFQGCRGGHDCPQDPYVDVDDVVGKVVVLMWPPGRFEVLHRPATFDTVPAGS